MSIGKRIKIKRFLQYTPYGINFLQFFHKMMMYKANLKRKMRKLSNKFHILGEGGLICFAQPTSGEYYRKTLSLMIKFTVFTVGNFSQVWIFVRKLKKNIMPKCTDPTDQDFYY